MKDANLHIFQRSISDRKRLFQYHSFVFEPSAHLPPSNILSGTI